MNSDASDSRLADSRLADTAPGAASEDELRELQDRLARLEAQVFAHSERIAEFDAAARTRQRRALWLRLVLLVFALAAFFAIKMGLAGGP